MAFPIILSLVLSLSNFSGGKIFAGGHWKITGFQQYGQLFVDNYFWHALKNNILIVLISVFGQLPLGLFLAYLIYRKSVKFGEFWQGILYVPSIISVIVIGIMWNLIFSPYGPLAEIINKGYALSYSSNLSNVMASYIGTNGKLQVTDDLVHKILAINPGTANSFFTNPPVELKAMLLDMTNESIPMIQSDLTHLMAPVWSTNFLNKEGTAMIPIMFVTLWCWTGMYLIIFLANMQKIDSQVLESAQIDGAKERSILAHIILPELSGVIMNTAILCIAGSLSSFALIYAMTGGGPARITQVLSIYMYEKAFMGTPDYPLANAISIMMVVFSLILIMITKVVQKKVGGNDD
ncbi:sugar ABC transporter permease [uncultured Sphaerochaeta sp.]|uniref:carbohydrate ABC transporter permease n=1 Tax=uncultured Sphaerochaeta sp. TaxID=886478 RepID=UPI002A0A503B|nr:sugar ABC transporter permease [uncultured Sphaerochaeta sp.]